MEQSAFPSDRIKCEDQKNDYLHGFHSFISNIFIFIFYSFIFILTFIYIYILLKCKKCNNQRRDYLNGFQICSMCCKQMEQMTPSGFKPNFKFEECKLCHMKHDYLNEFSECENCEKCK